MVNFGRGLMYFFFVIALITYGHSLSFNVDRLTYNSTQDWSSTLAVDNSNKVHIMYRHIDETGGDAEIYYISNISGSWVYERVTNNTISDYPSTITVTPTGSPHVSYIGDNETQVYYAKKVGGNWVLDAVTGNSNYKIGASIGLGPDSTPNLAYYQLNPGKRIYYATLVSGEWQIESIPNSDSASPCLPSLGIDSEYKAHIVFGQRLGGNPDIFYATNQTGTWQIVNITNDTAVDDRASLALDYNDFIHVVFTRNDEIYYGNNCTGQFEFEQVTNNAVSDRLPSLCIDKNGNAHIVCHETPAVGNIYYYSNEPGYWRQVPVYEENNNKTLSARNIALDRDGYVHVTFCAGGNPSTVEVYHAVSESIVGIKEKISEVYNKPYQLQITPNPFHDKVSIVLRAESKELTAPGSIPFAPCIKIYDVTGQLVKSFSCPSHYTLRSTQIIWNGIDDFGRKLPSGIYFCYLQSNDIRLVEKFVILK